MAGLEEDRRAEQGDDADAGTHEEVTPGPYVLLAISDTDEAIVGHGVLRPGTALVEKPFTQAALARKVREVLDAG